MPNTQLIDNETGISKSLVFLFSVIGGAAVGNLYWAHPLLKYIAESMNISLELSSFIVTVTQLGYAMGVFLIVPLGDILNRKKLIPRVMFTSSIALMGCALAPNYYLLLLSLFLVGLTTVTGQLLVPLAGDLAKAEERGRVIGAIVSGILTGILLSRTISGIMADVFGWRSIYFLASITTLFFAFMLNKNIPTTKPKATASYLRLLQSVFACIYKYREVQLVVILSSTIFCVFTLFWTGITFLLSSSAYNYSMTQIGMVGLVGLAGAVAAKRAGYLYDKGWSFQATIAALIAVLLSLLIANIGGHSIAALLLAVLLIDIAIQTLNVINQTKVCSVEPALRSRLNTAFVVCNFIGGAIGSSAAGSLWQMGGWSAIIIGQTALALVALFIVVIGKQQYAAKEI